MLSTSAFKERFELLVAGRLLRSKRSTHLSLISVMSVSGIALGVAALIVVLAVNTGFQGAFQERILSTWPHMVAMRRGLDLRDWRDVVHRIEKLNFVRTVNPATYDDMMLSSANGRAGAVVRGVPAITLKGLPEGVVVAGELDLRGEAPIVTVTAPMSKPATDEAKGLPQVHVADGRAAARHVVIVQPQRKGSVDGNAAQVVATLSAVIPPQGDLGGLLIIDRGACGDDGETTTRAEKSGLTLRYAVSKEAVRHGLRTCGVVAQWELMSGVFELEIGDGDDRRTMDVEVETGSTSVVVIGTTADAHIPGPNAIAPTVAAIAVVEIDGAKVAALWPGQEQAQRADGQWHAFSAGLPTIAIGEGLAKKLSVKIGDEVRAVSPLRAEGTGSGSSAAGRFEVRTIVRTGFYDHDQRLALVDFTAAQRFLGRGDVAHWVDVRIHDALLAKRRIPALKAALEPVTLEDMLRDVQRMKGKIARIQSEIVPGLVIRKPRHSLDMVDNWVAGFRAARQARTRAMSMFRVIDWEEMNRNIFDAARMQKVAMSLFPFIIVLVAALNVIGTQAVVVHERSRDIAIMRAMGATKRSVGSIFLVQGLAVGLVGTAIGLLLGGIFCLLLEAVGYPLDPHVYLISELPVRIEAETFFVAGGAATLLTFGAAWLAARRAAVRSPVQGLQRLD